MSIPLLPTLATEALVVGLVLGAALAAVAALWPSALRGGPARTAALGLVLGAIVHLAFEAAGLNAKYCRQGRACLL